MIWGELYYFFMGFFRFKSEGYYNVYFKGCRAIKWGNVCENYFLKIKVFYLFVFIDMIYY